jgi:hypothetical protein
MPIETITVFRSGAFASEPAPDWLRRVNAVAEETDDWDSAVRQVLGMFDGVAKVQDGTAVEVNQWRTPGGGMYVEFTDVFRVIAAVWIPEPADWIPFYTGHIAPFLHAHAQLATNDQLERIGNCLIAYARHGKGEHVNRDCGRSHRDLDRDREIVQRMQAEGPPWRLRRDKRSRNPSHGSQSA